MHNGCNRQCWVCERKVYTFFFWSPLYAEFERRRIALTEGEEEIIKAHIFTNRDTNLERQSNRSVIDERLATPPKKKYDSYKKEEVQVDSEDVSVDLSALSNDEITEESYSSLNDRADRISKIYQPERHKTNAPCILGAFNNWQ